MESSPSQSAVRLENPVAREGDQPSLWQPFSVAELLLVGIILVLGLIHRGWHFELSTVEHFDEGVYASNLWFGEDSNFRYPMRHLYAPSLLPALIEWTMILSGKISGSLALIP